MSSTTTRCTGAYLGHFRAKLRMVRLYCMVAWRMVKSPTKEALVKSLVVRLMVFRCQSTISMIFILAGENAEKFNAEEYLVTIPEWKIVGGLRATEDPETFELYTM